MARNALVAVVAAAAVDGGGEIPSKIFGHDFQSFFLLEDKYRREQEEEEQQTRRSAAAAAVRTESEKIQISGLGKDNRRIL